MYQNCWFRNSWVIPCCCTTHSTLISVLPPVTSERHCFLTCQLVSGSLGYSGLGSSASREAEGWWSWYFIQQQNGNVPFLSSQDTSWEYPGLLLQYFCHAAPVYLLPASLYSFSTLEPQYSMVSFWVIIIVQLALFLFTSKEKKPLNKGVIIHSK